jgi:predicted NUDIX family phosphoesterase
MAHNSPITTQTSSTAHLSHDELILAVKRENLLPQGGWFGLETANLATYLEIINTHKEFLWRSALEQDPAYKQIIPYLIFQYQDSYFLMQRREQASEQRLKSKFSLGIGGHIRQEDMSENNLFAWAQREFHEEVQYAGTFTMETLGMLNDDTTEVGKVHFGLVLLLKGDSPEISIKTEHRHGSLATMQEIEATFEKLETWSQFVFNALRNRN